MQVLVTMADRQNDSMIAKLRSEANPEFGQTSMTNDSNKVDTDNVRELVHALS